MPTTKDQKATLRRFQRRSDLFSLLASPIRLMILDKLLRVKKCNVGDLADSVGAGMSSVSNHLALLRNAGIVIDDKEGNVVYYSIGSEVAQQLKRIDGARRSILKATKKARRDE